MQNIHAIIIWVFITVLLWRPTSASGQVDQQALTQFMLTQPLYNPGFSFHKSGLSFVMYRRNNMVQPLRKQFKHTGMIVNVGIDENYSAGLTTQKISLDEDMVKYAAYLSGTYTTKITEQRILSVGARIGLDALQDFSDVNIQNHFAPNLGLGGYFIGKKYYYHFSVPHLFKPPEEKMLLADTRFNPQIRDWHYYLGAGYKYTLSAGFYLFPTILIRDLDLDVQPDLVDVNMGFLWFWKFWTSVGFRSDNTITGSLGYYVYHDIKLIVSYDDHLGADKTNSKSFVEVMFSFGEVYFSSLRIKRRYLNRGGKFQSTYIRNSFNLGLLKGNKMK